MTPTPGTVPYVTAAPNRTGKPKGLLKTQTGVAAELSAILSRSAQDLWDVATYDNSAQMYDEARAIASRILAACPGA